MRSFLVLSVIILISAVCVQSTTAEWYVLYMSPYFPSDPIIDRTSLKLDREGEFRLSYYSAATGDLGYVEGDNDGIYQMLVDRGVGTYGDHSLYLDPLTKNPHIAYYDNTNGCLKLARLDRTSYTWIIQNLTNSHEYGWAPCIGSPSPGGPLAISYADHAVGKGALWYTWWNGTGWEKIGLDYDSFPGDTSLSFDSSGRPQIVYTNRVVHDLRIAFKNFADLWDFGWIEDYPGASNPSLAFDSHNVPHLCYADKNPSEGLKYWTYVGGIEGWTSSTIDPTGEHDVSLVLDKDGHPHVAYINSSFTVKYAEYSGSSWEISPVYGQVKGGTGISLALDYHDNPHMFWTEFGGGLNYTRFIPSGIGVFRPSTHTFYLDFNGNGVWDGSLTDRAHNFGLNGDYAVSGDWNGDEVVNIGGYRPSTHTFYLDLNGNGRWDGAATDRLYNFGLSGDIPVTGDWRGAGITMIGVFRPSTHTFYLDRNGNGVWDGTATDRAYNFGLTGDLPVSGDWGGFGTTSIGVFRPSTHTFYLDLNGNGRWDGAATDRQYNFGLSGDIPICWDHATLSKTAIGVYRPSTHTLYLDRNGNGKWDGSENGPIYSEVKDRAYNFGLSGDLPVSGMWK